MTYLLSVYVTRDGEGWSAFSPDFPECRVAGRTREDALAGLRDELRVRVEDGLGDDESLATSDPRGCDGQGDLFAGAGQPAFTALTLTL